MPRSKLLQAGGSGASGTDGSDRSGGPSSRRSRRSAFRRKASSVEAIDVEGDTTAGGNGRRETGQQSRSSRGTPDRGAGEGRMAARQTQPDTQNRRPRPTTDPSGDVTTSSVGQAVSRFTSRAADRLASTATSAGAAYRDFAQETTATAIDTIFQGDNTAFQRRIGIEEENISDDEIDVTGPAVTVNQESVTTDEEILEPGEEGELNTDITDSLTRGKGLFSDDQIRGIRQRGRRRFDYFSVGSEADRFVTGLTGSELAGNLARGVGRLPGDIAQSPSTIAVTADLATETAVNLPRTVGQYGAGPTAYTLLETGGRATKATTQAAKERPATFAGQIAGGVVLGTAATRALETAPNVYRSARIRAGGGDIYDFDEVSDPPTTTEGMELPGFTQAAQQDPDVARREFLEQARQTDIAGDDPVAFHGRAAEDVRDYGGFGRTFEAPTGSSELSGLFQSADLSPLRLRERGGRLSLPRVGLPNPRTGSARVLAERDVDVDVTEGATNREVSDFLAEDADRSKSFVRTDEGGPTPEQEAIAPPGSRFETADGLFGVRVGGRRIPFTDRRIGGEIVPGRLTRRTDTDTDADAETGDVRRDETMTDVEMAEETRRALDEAVDRQDTTVTPAPGSLSDGVTDGASSGTTPSTAGRPDTDTTPTGAPDDTTPTGERPPADEPPRAPPRDQRPPRGPPEDRPQAGPSGGRPPITPPPERPPSSSSPPSSGPPSDVAPPGSSPTAPPSGPSGAPTPTRPRRLDLGDEDDEPYWLEKQFVGYGKDWENPVADAEEALDETLGTVTEEMDDVLDGGDR